MARRGLTEEERAAREQVAFLQGELDECNARARAQERGSLSPSTYHQMQYTFFGFGKHRSKSVLEVYREDRPYLNWMRDTVRDGIEFGTYDHERNPNFTTIAALVPPRVDRSAAMCCQAEFALNRAKEHLSQVELKYKKIRAANAKGELAELAYDLLAKVALQHKLTPRDVSSLACVCRAMSEALGGIYAEPRVAHMCRSHKSSWVLAAYHLQDVDPQWLTRERLPPVVAAWKTHHAAYTQLVDRCKTLSTRVQAAQRTCERASKDLFAQDDGVETLEQAILNVRKYKTRFCKTKEDLRSLNVQLHSRRLPKDDTFNAWVTHFLPSTR